MQPVARTINTKNKQSKFETNMKVKISTLFAALILSAGALFAEGTEVNGIYYIFDDVNSVATVTYQGSSCSAVADEYTGTVVIPEKVTNGGKEYSVDSIGEGAFSECTGLTSVSIPNSIKSIGEGAFSECSGLTSFTIPNAVTSIGVWAFGACSQLASVTIGTSVKSIGEAAFYGCSGLTSVEIPNSVDSISDYAFGRCSSLNSITVASDNSKYESRDCNAIIEKSTNTLVVGCKSTVIPNSVTGIGTSAFGACSDLTNIAIPTSVKSIGKDAFAACGLTSVEIPNSVDSIGEAAFYKCSALTSVTIGTSVKIICKGAFYECAQLATVTCNATEPPTAYDTSFYNYSATLKVPCSSKEAYAAATCWKDFTNVECIGSTVGLAQTEMSELYTESGRIVCAGEYRIYDLLGRDVTRQNGNLHGVYVVKTADTAVKVVVK